MTRREGRRFGAEMAVGFAVIAGLVWWRGHDGAAVALGTIAAVSAVAALVIPGRLGPVRAGWMALGHAIGRVMSPLFFGIIYFAVLTPIGLARRTFGRSPLARDPAATSYWMERAVRSPEQARRAMERYF